MLMTIQMLFYVNVLHILALEQAQFGLLCKKYESVKKTLLYSERDNTLRKCYLDNLSDESDKYGEENIVYFDESGFEEEVVRPHGWAPIGTKVHGEKSGSKRHRTNLIMAQRGREWLSPMTFDFACNSSVVNTWLEK